MIAEEILNLSMLGMGPERFGQEGSRPINLKELNLSQKISGNLPMEQLWPETSGEESDPQIEGIGLVSPENEEEGRRWHPIWVALGLLLAGVAAFLVVFLQEQG